MKIQTETQITEENIKGCNKFEFFERMEHAGHTCGDNRLHEKGDIPNLCKKCFGRVEEHKASCQRFLGFLEDYEIRIPHKIEDECPKCNEKYSISPIINEDKIESKIIDLKQAIKLYEEAGI